MITDLDGSGREGERVWDRGKKLDRVDSAGARQSGSAGAATKDHNVVVAMSAEVDYPASTHSDHAFASAAVLCPFSSFNTIFIVYILSQLISFISFLNCHVSIVQSSTVLWPPSEKWVCGPSACENNLFGGFIYSFLLKILIYTFIFKIVNVFIYFHLKNNLKSYNVSILLNFIFIL